MSDRKVEHIDFQAAATITGTGTISIGDVGKYQEISTYFHITSKDTSATSLDFILQDSPDDVNYFNRATVDQITAVGDFTHRLTNTIGKFMRASYNAVGSWVLQGDAIVKS